ncbi:hypothetical protein F5884DRAFT_757537 [Xylogone sp. PMI_703]|nr:hypothetical protein F5884DRAFT_757537 [Xylogone sp. PMI_703]
MQKLSAPLVPSSKQLKPKDKFSVELRNDYWFNAVFIPLHGKCGLSSGWYSPRGLIWYLQNLGRSYKVGGINGDFNNGDEPHIDAEQGILRTSARNCVEKEKQNLIEILKNLDQETADLMENLIQHGKGSQADSHIGRAECSLIR